MYCLDSTLKKSRWISFDTHSVSYKNQGYNTSIMKQPKPWQQVYWIAPQTLYEMCLQVMVLSTSLDPVTSLDPHQPKTSSHPRNKSFVQFWSLFHGQDHLVLSNYIPHVFPVPQVCLCFLANHYSLPMLLFGASQTATKDWRTNSKPSMVSRISKTYHPIPHVSLDPWTGHSW